MASGPSDPNAPSSAGVTISRPAAQTAPPMPFSEWPYGGATPLGRDATELSRQPRS